MTSSFVILQTLTPSAKYVPADHSSRKSATLSTSSFALIWNLNPETPYKGQKAQPSVSDASFSRKGWKLFRLAGELSSSRLRWTKGSHFRSFARQMIVRKMAAFSRLPVGSRKAKQEKRSFAERLERSWTKGFWQEKKKLKKRKWRNFDKSVVGVKFEYSSDLNKSVLIQSYFKVSIVFLLQLLR